MNQKECFVDNYVRVKLTLKIQNNSNTVSNWTFE